MSNDRDIQFGALKIFAAVAQSDTLTDAAQKLGITQSAVSQAIAQLEESADSVLVVRRSRPIKLTPAGQVMQRHADNILALTRKMLKEVVAASSGVLPKLTIGIVDSFCNVAGQELIDSISKIAPQLSIQTGINLSLSRALIRHELDMLISSHSLEEETDLERYPILRDPFVMLVAKSKYKDGETSPQSLANDIPFIRYANQTTRIGVLTDLVLRRMNLEVQTRYEFDNTQNLLRMVGAGRGWAIATSLCVIQHPELLDKIELCPLAQGSHARYLSLMARHNEIGETPSIVATICRDIFTDNVVPKILARMPWLEGQAIAVTDGHYM